MCLEMMPRMVEIAIARGSLERLDDLEPLWKAMHAHHRSVAGHLTDIAPFRSDEQSWERRRAHYEGVLASPDAFVLVAERDGRPIAYAVVAVSGTHGGEREGQELLRAPRVRPLPHVHARPGSSAAVASCSRASYLRKAGRRSAATATPATQSTPPETIEPLMPTTLATAPALRFPSSGPAE